MNLKRILIIPFLLLIAGVTLAACGSDSDSSKTEVSDAWARSSPPGQTTSAIYAKLTGGDEADRLVAVAVPADVAGKAEIHETTESGAGGSGEMNGEDTGNAHMDGSESGDSGMDKSESGDGGMDKSGSDDSHMKDTAGHDGGSMPAGGHGTMAMRQVEGIDIPAGGEVMLEPGGFHIMLFDLAGPLTVGDTVPVTLTFEQAGEVKVDAEVRDS